MVIPIIEHEGWVWPDSKALKSLWFSCEEKERRARADLKLRILRSKHRDDIEALVSCNYVEGLYEMLNVEHRVHYQTNLLRRVVNETSLVYALGAIRYLKGDKKNGRSNADEDSIDGDGRDDIRNEENDGGNAFKRDEGDGGQDADERKDADEEVKYDRISNEAFDAWLQIVDLDIHMTEVQRLLNTVDQVVGMVNVFDIRGNPQLVEAIYTPDKILAVEDQRDPTRVVMLVIPEVVDRRVDGTPNLQFTAIDFERMEDPDAKVQPLQTFKNLGTEQPGVIRKGDIYTRKADNKSFDLIPHVNSSGEYGGDSSKTVIYHAWTESNYWILDDEFRVIPNPANPENINPYYEMQGQVSSASPVFAPFWVARGGMATDSFWYEAGLSDDAAAATLEVCLLRTKQNVDYFQARKQPILPGDPEDYPPSQQILAGIPAWKGQVSGTSDLLDFTVDVAAHDELINRRVFECVHEWGISAEQFQLSGEKASAEALLIQSEPVRKRNMEQRKHLIEAEKQRYDTHVIVVTRNQMDPDYSGLLDGLSLPARGGDGGLDYVVDVVEAQPKMTPSEEQARDDWDLKNNLITLLDIAARRNPDLDTREKQERQILENADINRKFRIASVAGGTLINNSNPLLNKSSNASVVAQQAMQQMKEQSGSPGMPMISPQRNVNAKKQ